MPRQRTHHLLQPLAHQHHLRAGILQRLQLLHAFFLQQRLQLVLELFLAQQIKPVARDPAQYGMHDPRRRLPVRRIKKWPQQRHQQHQGSRPPAREGLAVPGEESDRTDRGQFQQAAFDPPVHRRRRPRTTRRRSAGRSRRVRVKRRPHPASFEMVHTVPRLPNPAAAPVALGRLAGVIHFNLSLIKDEE